MTFRCFVGVTFLLSCLAIPDASAVDDVAASFFDAIAAKQIDAEFIPVDSTVANVIVKNLGEEGLRVAMPEAFVGVPVLAQFGVGQGQGPGQQGQGQGQGQNGGGGQTVGGGGQQQGIGMGQVGMGQNQQGGNLQNGFFRIPAGGTIRWKVTTVCLEHGKPEPRPKMKYQIQPAESFTDDAAVIELCRIVGSGRVSQPVAQAAAWHLANDLSWDDIASMNRIESKYTGNVRYFTDEQIAKAKLLVNELVSPASSSSIATSN